MKCNTEAIHGHRYSEMCILYIKGVWPVMPLLCSEQIDRYFFFWMAQTVLIGYIENNVGHKIIFCLQFSLIQAPQALNKLSLQWVTNTPTPQLLIIIDSRWKFIFFAQKVTKNIVSVIIQTKLETRKSEFGQILVRRCMSSFG